MIHVCKNWNKKEKELSNVNKKENELRRMQIGLKKFDRK